MKAIYLFTIGLLAIASPIAVSESIYKSKDSFGNTIYSDKPLDNAEKIQLPKLQTFTPVQVPAGKPEQSKAQKDTIIEYKISITSPVQGQTFLHDSNHIPVKINLEPTLDSKHRLRILVNNEIYSNNQQHPFFKVENLPRGQHQIQVEVIDLESQKIIIQSNSVTIFQKRPIVMVK